MHIYAVAFPGSDIPADEAGNNAHVQTIFFWNRFQNEPAKAGNKEKQKKKAAKAPASGLDLGKDQSGYGLP